MEVSENPLDQKGWKITRLQSMPTLVFIPIPPQALGEDIDVPFISCVPLSVQLGTAAIAPPGALILTPNEPSVLYETRHREDSCLLISLVCQFLV